MTNSIKPLILILLLLGLISPSCLPAVQPAVPTSTPFPSATTAFTPTSAATPTTPPSPTTSPTPLPAPDIRRVLIISVDGLRPDAIALAPMPNLMRLMQTGAYSLKAQTIFPSVTLPSHASMLTGECPSKHGVDWNDTEPERGYAIGVDIFDLAHAAGLQTVMLVGKKKLEQITEPTSLDIFKAINDRDVVLADWLVNNFPEKFGLMFIHFATDDDMGHVYGWLSPEQLSVLRRADEAIASVVNAVDAHGLRDETLIIITADHGGHGMGHGTRQAVDMTIPWIAIGPNIKPGELVTPIETTDTAATAAWALHLPIPSNWDGVPVKEAFGLPYPPRGPFCP